MSLSLLLLIELFLLLLLLGLHLPLSILRHLLPPLLLVLLILILVKVVVVRPTSHVLPSWRLVTVIVVLVLVLPVHTAVADHVVADDRRILLRQIADIADPSANARPSIAALVAYGTRIGPTLLPLVPRLDEILGLRPKHVRHHALEHPVATVLDPPIDKLLGDRRRQLIVFLRRQQPVLLHALMPAILRNALGTQHIAHVPAQPVQTPPRPRLRPLLQIQIVDVDVVVVDFHDNVLQMLARLSRFLTSNPIRFHDKNGSVWYLGTG